MNNYIDAHKFMDELNDVQIEFDENYKGLGKAKAILSLQPIVDVVEIPSRCGVCKYSSEGKDWISRTVYKCHRFNITGLDYDDFCSKGEKKIKEKISHGKSL